MAEQELLASQSVDIKIVDHSKEVLAAVNGALKLCLDVIGDTCVGYAQDECPVDTGNLLNSINYISFEDDIEVYIGSEVEYAPKVEFRDMHHEIGKAHFLRDAGMNHAAHYTAIVAAALAAL